MTINIININTITIAGYNQTDPGSAIATGTITFAQWFAAFQVWFARQITATTIIANAISTPLLASANSALATAQQTLTAQTNQINQLGAAYIAATTDSQRQAVLQQFYALTAPGIAANLQAQINTHQAAITALTPQLAAAQTAATTPPPVPATPNV